MGVWVWGGMGASCTHATPPICRAIDRRCIDQGAASPPMKPFSIDMPCFASDGLRELHTSRRIGLLAHFSADSFVVFLFYSFVIDFFFPASNHFLSGAPLQQWLLPF